MTKAPPKTRRSGKAPRACPDVGDFAMLSASFSDPMHWFLGKILWTDGMEVLVEQGGIAGQSPQKMLHDSSYIRCFGSLAFCKAEKRKAENTVRDAARQIDEVEELAADLRRKLMTLFETVAAKALDKAKQQERSS